MADSVIRAAGVVVVKGPRSNPRVLLIHRPRHDDWSLPKGKLDKGEHVVAAAVRECDEETGVVPILSVPLGQQQYQVLGRDKTVDYWRAHIGKSGRFIPNDEVDQCSWLHPHEAHERLTYARDNEFLDAALAGPKTWPLILLRHTDAEKRSDHKGPDYRRPLAGRGRTHAKNLVPLLSAYGVESVVSSTATRCVDTVKPYAASTKRKVKRVSAFSEESAERKPHAALSKLLRLALKKKSIVVCSHRPVLPLLLAPFAAEASREVAATLSAPLDPGGMIVLHRAILGGEWHIEAVERHD